MRPGPRGRQTHCMELTNIARASGHVVALALVVTGRGVETRDAPPPPPRVTPLRRGWGGARRTPGPRAGPGVLHASGEPASWSVLARQGPGGWLSGDANVGGRSDSA